MQITKLKPLFYTVIVLLALVGSLMYFASIFSGILLILAAAVLYFVYYGLSVGKGASKALALSFLKSLLIPVIGVASALLIGGIIMAVTGYDPVTAYKALFYGGLVKNWSVSVLNAAPLIFTGLSIAFAFKAGLFNIGAEGQYYVGAVVATFLGLHFNMPALLSIPIIFLVAGLLAASYNFIPALLKVKTGAHEVITTMMFAQIARYLSSIFIRGMGGSSDGPHPYVTDPILKSNWLLKMKSIFPHANYRVHIGILIAIGMALFVQYILTRTKFGFEIRAVGQNKDAARGQGIKVGRNIFIALLFAGFLAGFSGVNQVLGLDHKLYENLNAGYGWDGISVALLASNNPIGVIFTSLLWGVLAAGGQYMSRTVQTPNSIVEIIKGIILFLIVAKYIYIHIGHKFKNKKKEEREAVK
ncbi:MAG: ABC transporter permease [Spirochaetes bacterium]|nr:MAG: ABC transporter permease [Spirochaetota bacterium]